MTTPLGVHYDVEDTAKTVGQSLWDRVEFWEDSVGVSGESRENEYQDIVNDKFFRFMEGATTKLPVARWNL